jgi:OPA family glycerol-3-phosphate transporter-like MFS transporter
MSPAMSTVDPALVASAPPVVHPPGFVARRMVNWVFLGLMYGFFYMSRYNLAAIQVALSDKFGWSHTNYGDITSVALAVYGFSVFFNGPLADKIGGKRAILVGSAGAAIFNFLFGACFLFLGHPAVMNKGVVVTPAVLTHGMTASTMIATFSVLWGANHYFQSFGALSIVKINAAWFQVRERGSFAGIFGIMIQSGRFLAAYVSPLVLSFLPWQWCFWVPAAVLCVMFFLNRRFVEDSPAKAGFEFDTGDETPEEAAKKPTLGFVLRKVFASRAAWLIAAASMCIGMVRNSIDHWWAGYFSTVFSIKTEDFRSSFVYNAISFGTPLMAIAGGLVAGHASDKIFGARRAPVIFIAFVGQALTLLLLSQSLHSKWAGCLFLLFIAFFIQGAHSLVGGAASMDFGGKKAVATAAGLFDGAQYLAGAIINKALGPLLDYFKDAKHPGAEYDVWPLAPLPFALLGALLVAQLWDVVPGRTLDAVEMDRQRAAAQRRVWSLERVALALFGLIGGAYATLALLIPQRLARALLAHPLPPGGVLLHQMMAGVQLGLALVALVAARSPRPPRSLVRAVAVGLGAATVGPLFAALTQSVPWAEIRAYAPFLALDLLVAVVLTATQLARRAR